MPIHIVNGTVVYYYFNDFTGFTEETLPAERIQFISGAEYARFQEVRL